MAIVNDILAFNFSPLSLKQAAANAFPLHFTRQFENNISKLETISEQIGKTDFDFKESNLIPFVFNKFKNAFKKREFNHHFEKRELKTLAYALSYSENKQSPILRDPDELYSVFTFVESRWRDSFIIGFIGSYLNNWGDKNYAASLEILGNYIFKKLTQYDGNRKVLLSLRASVKFFSNSNGDVLLGSELAIERKQIKDATAYLSIPNSWFVYPYFSKVILAYYEKRKKDIPQFIDDIINALREHNNPKTNKLLISKLIIQANMSEFENIQNYVKNIAFEFVGDPDIPSKWSPFVDATEKEISEIKEARNILIQWLTKEFISVFFEKCINDPRRKKFWLRYVKEILRFRVVGSLYIKNKLLNIDSINQIVEPRFCKTNSTSDNNAALMFTMKNYLFIEFSDAGAFYAYKLSNPSAPSIDSQFFHSTSDLKITTMRLLAYRTGTHIKEVNDEGKLGHNDGDLKWEYIAQRWIQKYLEINV